MKKYLFLTLISLNFINILLAQDSLDSFKPVTCLVHYLHETQNYADPNLSGLKILHFTQTGTIFDSLTLKGEKIYISLDQKNDILISHLPHGGRQSSHLEVTKKKYTQTSLLNSLETSSITSALEIMCYIDEKETAENRYFRKRYAELIELMKERKLESILLSEFNNPDF